MNLYHFLKRSVIVAIALFSSCVCLAQHKELTSSARDLELKFVPNEALTAAYNLEKKGLASFGKKDYQQAAQYFEQALQGYEKFWGKGHPVLAMVYQQLAIVLHMQGKYNEAIVYYKKAKALFGDPDLSSYSEASYRICDANLQQAIQHKKERYLMLDMLEPYSTKQKQQKSWHWHRNLEPKFVPNEDLTAARKLEQQGEEHWQSGDFKQAVQCFEQALQGYEKFWGKGHPILGVVYHNLAAALHKYGKYIEAMANYDQALKCFDQGGWSMHGRNAVIPCCENWKRARQENKSCFILIDDKE